MTKNTQENVWPLSKFYFAVKFASHDNAASFQEVSGLDTETQPIEYRHGDSESFSTIKMPGLTKFSNISLKRGIFVGDNTFRNWYEEIKLDLIKRETVTIQLLDESGSPTMTWTLANAWPTKISGSDLKSDANEIAVESLELAYEVLTVSTH